MKLIKKEILIQEERVKKSLILLINKLIKNRFVNTDLIIRLINKYFLKINNFYNNMDLLIHYHQEIYLEIHN